jgi:hypothetical protein
LLLHPAMKSGLEALVKQHATVLTPSRTSICLAVDAGTDSELEAAIAAFGGVVSYPDDPQLEIPKDDETESSFSFNMEVPNMAAFYADCEYRTETIVQDGFAWRFLVYPKGRNSNAVGVFLEIDDVCLSPSFFVRVVVFAPAAGVLNGVLCRAISQALGGSNRLLSADFLTSLCTNRDILILSTNRAHLTTSSYTPSYPSSLPPTQSGT